MKKIAWILLCGALAFSVAACGNRKASKERRYQDSINRADSLAASEVQKAADAAEAAAAAAAAAADSLRKQAERHH